MATYDIPAEGSAPSEQGDVAAEAAPGGEGAGGFVTVAPGTYSPPSAPAEATPADAPAVTMTPAEALEAYGYVPAEAEIPGVTITAPEPAAPPAEPPPPPPEPPPPEPPPITMTPKEALEKYGYVPAEAEIPGVTITAPEVAEPPVVTMTPAEALEKYGYVPAEAEIPGVTITAPAPPPIEELIAPVEIPTPPKPEAPPVEIGSALRAEQIVKEIEAGKSPKEVLTEGEKMAGYTVEQAQSYVSAIEEAGVTPAEITERARLLEERAIKIGMGEEVPPIHQIVGVDIDKKQVIVLDTLTGQRRWMPATEEQLKDATEAIKADKPYLEPYRPPEGEILLPPMATVIGEVEWGKPVKFRNYRGEIIDVPWEKYKELTEIEGREFLEELMELKILEPGSKIIQDEKTKEWGLIPATVVREQERLARFEEEYVQVGDGKWMAKSDIESVQINFAGGYDILIEKGYDSFMGWLNENYIELPDGQRIAKDVLDGIEKDYPEQHKILTEEGYGAFERAIEEAYKDLDLFKLEREWIDLETGEISKVAPIDYDVPEAIKSGKYEKQLSLIYSGKAVEEIKEELRIAYGIESDIVQEVIIPDRWWYKGRIITETEREQIIADFEARPVEELAIYKPFEAPEDHPSAFMYRWRPALVLASDPDWQRLKDRPKDDPERQAFLAEWQQHILDTAMLATAVATPYTVAGVTWLGARLVTGLTRPAAAIAGALVRPAMLIAPKISPALSLAPGITSAVVGFVPRAAVSLAKLAIAGMPLAYVSSRVIDEYTTLGNMQTKWEAFSTLPAVTKDAWAKESGYDKEFVDLTETEQADVLLHWTPPAGYNLTEWGRILIEKADEIRENASKGVGWLEEKAPDWMKPLTVPVTIAGGTVGGIVEGLGYAANIPLVAGNLVDKLPRGTAKEYATMVAVGMAAFFTTEIPRAIRANPALGGGRAIGLFVFTPIAFAKFAKGVGVDLPRSVIRGLGGSVALEYSSLRVFPPPAKMAVFLRGLKGKVATNVNLEAINAQMKALGETRRNLIEEMKVAKDRAEIKSLQDRLRDTTTQYSKLGNELRGGIEKGLYREYQPLTKKEMLDMGASLVKQLATKGVKEAKVEVGGMIVKLRTTPWQQVVGDTYMHFTIHPKEWIAKQKTGESVFREEMTVSPQAAERFGEMSSRGEIGEAGALIMIHTPPKYKPILEKLLGKGEVEIESWFRKQWYDPIPGEAGRGTYVSPITGKTYPVLHFMLRGQPSDWKGLSPKDVIEIQANVAKEATLDFMFGSYGRMRALKEKFGEKPFVKRVDSAIAGLRVAKRSKGEVVAKEEVQIPHPESGMMTEKVRGIVTHTVEGKTKIELVNDRADPEGVYGLVGGSMNPKEYLIDTPAGVKWIAEVPRGQRPTPTWMLGLSSQHIGELNVGLTNTKYLGTYGGKVSEHGLYGSRVYTAEAMTLKLDPKTAWNKYQRVKFGYKEPEVRGTTWWDGKTEITVYPYVYDILRAVSKRYNLDMSKLKIYKENPNLLKARDKGFADRVQEGRDLDIDPASLTKADIKWLKAWKARRLIEANAPASLIDWMKAEPDIRFINEVMMGRRRAGKVVVKGETTKTEAQQLVTQHPEYASPKVRELLKKEALTDKERVSLAREIKRVIEEPRRELQDAYDRLGDYVYRYNPREYRSGYVGLWDKMLTGSISYNAYKDEYDLGRYETLMQKYPSLVRVEPYRGEYPIVSEYTRLGYINVGKGYPTTPYPGYDYTPVGYITDYPIAAAEHEYPIAEYKYEILPYEAPPYVQPTYLAPPYKPPPPVKPVPYEVPPYEPPPPPPPIPEEPPPPPPPIKPKFKKWEKGSKIPAGGAYNWRQGAPRGFKERGLWMVWIHPFRQEDIFIDDEPLKGNPLYAEGAGSTQKTLYFVGEGTPPDIEPVDWGTHYYGIRGVGKEGKPELLYSRDPKDVYKGEIAQGERILPEGKRILPRETEEFRAEVGGVEDVYRRYKPEEIGKGKAMAISKARLADESGDIEREAKEVAYIEAISMEEGEGEEAERNKIEEEEPVEEEPGAVGLGLVGEGIFQEEVRVPFFDKPLEVKEESKVSRVETSPETKLPVVETTSEPESAEAGVASKSGLQEEKTISEPEEAEEETSIPVKVGKEEGLSPTYRDWWDDPYYEEPAPPRKPVGRSVYAERTYLGHRLLPPQVGGDL